ncbi:hypothetical protein IW261DRAFT_1469428 [Armillaria novae-zelandiae]|uniref:Uncharacterized protein n=1 Tax=Armillaria novae-zelandiae TaxID=153914 RepID=A0AA39PED9_9AGAR|nr:hypothetical protein IW261DRAFT_1469428 [Armillaria novae-zelandiae]
MMVKHRITTREIFGQCAGLFAFVLFFSDMSVQNKSNLSPVPRIVIFLMTLTLTPRLSNYRHLTIRMAQPLDIITCIQIVKFTRIAGETMLFPYIKDVTGCFALVLKAIEKLTNNDKIGRHECGLSDGPLSHAGTRRQRSVFSCPPCYSGNGTRCRSKCSHILLVQQIIR